MIEVVELRKRYGQLLAVDGLSFTAEPGQIFGLLGPNGAGKSTVLGCLSGLLEPDGGQIRLAGVDLASGPAARESLGLVPQELALYVDLTATQNLRYWGRAQGMSRSALRARVPALLERVGLHGRHDEPIKHFSGGMLRRLNFACGVVHQPKILLLDEPTVGVDPQSRVALLEAVRELAEEGCCVLYTTHYMEEAEELCHRVGILDHGRILAEGTVPELRTRVDERDVLRIAGRFEPEKVRRLFAEPPHALGDVEVLAADVGQLRLSLTGAAGRLPEIITLLQATGAHLGDTTVSQASLETLFIRLTGKELRE